MHHDTIIAHHIITEAKKHGEVLAVTIALGEAAKITKKELEPTITSLVDWKVLFEEVEARVECGCGYTGKPKILERGHDICYFECPECGNVPKIMKGGDIILKMVEVV